MRVLIGLAVLLFLLPKIALACFRAWWTEQKIAMYSQNVLGRDMGELSMRRVMVANRPLPDFDKWIHYVKGNFDLVGPKAIEVSRLQGLAETDRQRFQVAPGIVSPYQAKQAAGIAHVSEREIAVEFVKNDSRLRRIVLIVVWGLQWLVGVDKLKLPTPDQFTLFGVRLSNVTMPQAVEKIMAQLTTRSLKDDKQKVESATFAFVNADCANQYYSNDGYRNILNNFSSVFADGIGVKIAARLSGLGLRQNVNGTDMFPLLCEQLNTRNKRVFLLGATKSVIDKVANKLAKDYPNIVVADYVDGYSYKDEQLALRQRINRAEADILFVAMGAPRQEFWMEANRSCLNVSAIIGVGGLFDFYSESVSRAPEWLRELSLEWVWRLAVQPLDKGKRYLVGNPLFLARVLMNRRDSKQQQSAMEVS